MKKLAIVTATVLGLSTLFAGSAWGAADHLVIFDQQDTHR